MTPLDRLAAAYGIEPSYTDIWQRQHVISPETKRALLGAMGVGADSDAEIKASLVDVDDKVAAKALPDVLVEREGETISLPIRIETTGSDRLSWMLRTEDGRDVEGGVRVGDLPVTEPTEDDGRSLTWFCLPLPAELPLGYHQCTVSLNGRSLGETKIIVTPIRAYWPDGLERDGGLIGVTAPLYGLRSSRNTGIGDFADLAAIAEPLASRGTDLIGINPAHALFPSQPARISPYAPSSRNFLNVLLIALDQVPEVVASKQADAILSSPDGEAQLQTLRDQDLVNYPEVAAFKLKVLDIAFDAFLALKATTRRKAAFQAFIEAGGERLERHARFEALSEFLLEGDETLADWHDWPVDYQDPQSAAVQAFAESHHHRVAFYTYLQWLAEEQLEQAQATAKKSGMALGLYLDLAVGVAPDGAEAWSDQGLLINGVCIGAPPDDFNPDGQNWGLLPLSPMALRARGYEPFIEMLRRTMRHAGALRIDHVLGLARSFWQPAAGDGLGAYIRYPMRDLLGLLALESHRSQCVVIGEDLGTVPPDLRAALDEYGLLGCRLLYFERNDDGGFSPAKAYPKACIASIGTHDLATLKGFWQGRDIDWREKLELYADADQPALDRAERLQIQKKLLQLLASEGLLPDDVDRDQPPATLPQALVDAFHRFLGRTPAALKVVQLEDMVGAIEQANLPGTIDAYPNWRRKIAVPVEDLTSVLGLLACLKPSV